MTFNYLHKQINSLQSTSASETILRSAYSNLPFELNPKPKKMHPPLIGWLEKPEHRECVHTFLLLFMKSKESGYNYFFLICNITSYFLDGSILQKSFVNLDGNAVGYAHGDGGHGDSGHGDGGRGDV